MKMHELQAIGMKHTKGVTECLVQTNADDELCTCALGAQLFGRYAVDFSVTQAEYYTPQYYTPQSGNNQAFFSFYDKLDWDNVHQALDYLCETRPRLKSVKRLIKGHKVEKASEYWEMNTFTMINDGAIKPNGIRVERENARRLLVLALLRWLDL